jgi:multidrug efflux pump subunit AcrA (membrane-fusion protein)
MFANVKILLNRQERVVVVPEEALLDDYDEQIVFVREDDTFQRRSVQVGASENGLCEIVQGLSPGESVVVRGSYQLKSKLYDEFFRGSHVH